MSSSSAAGQTDEATRLQKMMAESRKREEQRRNEQRDKVEEMRLQILAQRQPHHRLLGNKTFNGSTSTSNSTKSTTDSISQSDRPLRLGDDYFPFSMEPSDGRVHLREELKSTEPPSSRGMVTRKMTKAEKERRKRELQKQRQQVERPLMVMLSSSLRSTSNQENVANVLARRPNVGGFIAPDLNLEKQKALEKYQTRHSLVSRSTEQQKEAKGLKGIVQKWTSRGRSQTIDTPATASTSGKPETPSSSAASEVDSKKDAKKKSIQNLMKKSSKDDKKRAAPPKKKSKMKETKEEKVERPPATSKIADVNLDEDDDEFEDEDIGLTEEDVQALRELEADTQPLVTLETAEAVLANRSLFQLLHEPQPSWNPNAPLNELRKRNAYFDDDHLRAFTASNMCMLHDDPQTVMEDDDASPFEQNISKPSTSGDPNLSRSVSPRRRVSFVQYVKCMLFNPDAGRGKKVFKSTVQPLSTGQCLDPDEN